MLRWLIAAILLAPVAAGTATASPGPPPPAYIVDAAASLVPTQTAATFDRYVDVLAGDVTVSVNGKQVASDKASWLALERRRLGKVERRVLGHAEGADSILVLDQIDDRSSLPDDSHFSFDPRYQVRAVRYQFGSDRLVHAISIVQTDGFLRAPS